MSVKQRSFSSQKLAKLQGLTFSYFIKEANSRNGLIPDNTRQGAPSSITAVGFSLAAMPIGVERKWISRKAAVKRVLTLLRFLSESEQSRSPNATGYKGFYYHFLDMKTGRRALKCELSTIDSAFLLAGALTVAEYFDRDTKTEEEIRTLGRQLYLRADWRWAQNNGDTVTHGWKPERGFLRYRWLGYDEALILYVLGLGSPTFSLPKKSYTAWTRSYEWKELYGQEHLYAGPLFIHQLSHMWIDFRGIQDSYMRKRGIDYFENSRRAVYCQQQYAIENPFKYRGYSKYIWGLTSGAGPGPAVKKIDGKVRRFYDYKDRGIPDGPDDGTLAPWAVIASLPFVPEVVLPSMQHFDENYPEMTSKYGFKCSFNPTFDSDKDGKGWVSKGYYGLDQGPIVMMIENYRTEFLWKLMKRCEYLVTGLRRAGFTGGWLDAA